MDQIHLACSCSNFNKAISQSINPVHRNHCAEIFSWHALLSRPHPLYQHSSPRRPYLHLINLQITQPPQPIAIHIPQSQGPIMSCAGKHRPTAFAPRTVDAASAVGLTSAFEAHYWELVAWSTYQSPFVKEWIDLMQLGSEYLRASSHKLNLQSGRSQSHRGSILLAS